jgi:hypothetical protein
MDLPLDARVLMNAIGKLARAKGFSSARVECRVNVRSELAIALLIPPRTPDEWGPPTPSPIGREVRRLARERRG